MCTICAPWHTVHVYTERIALCTVHTSNWRCSRATVQYVQESSTIACPRCFLQLITSVSCAKWRNVLCYCWLHIWCSEVLILRLVAGFCQSLRHPLPFHNPSLVLLVTLGSARDRTIMPSKMFLWQKRNILHKNYMSQIKQFITTSNAKYFKPKNRFQIYIAAIMSKTLLYGSM